MGALEDFLTAPSERLLVVLTKEQLLKVADHYAIELTSVSKSAKKEQFVDFIREFLKEKQVLPCSTPISVSPETPVAVSEPATQSNVNVTPSIPLSNVMPTTESNESIHLSYEQQIQLLKIKWIWNWRKGS